MALTKLNFGGSQTALSSANLPTGSVLQTKQSVKTNTFGSSSSTNVDITGMSVSITPSSSSSKILILVNTDIVGQDSATGIQLLRDSTEIYKGDTNDSRERFSSIGMYSNGTSPTTYSGGSVSIVFLDSPNTTSSVTYKIQGRARSGTWYINRSQYFEDNDNASVSASSITVMEIAG